MARDLDGSADYLERTTAILTATPATFAIWFRADTVTGSHRLITINDRGIAGDLLSLYQEAATLVAQHHDGGAGASSAVSSGTVVQDQWHHGAAVFDDDTNRHAYLDGGNKVSNSLVQNLVDVDTTTIGSMDYTSRIQYFNGDVAEAAIWNVALTDGEIKSLAAGMLPSKIRSANLLGYWPIYGLSSPEIDYSGKGNTMPVISAPPLSDHAPIPPGWGFDETGLVIPASAVSVARRRVGFGTGYAVRM
jgi:hypothetical protein